MKRYLPSFADETDANGRSDVLFFGVMIKNNAAKEAPFAAYRS
jgi:hypothetical protein